MEDEQKTPKQANGQPTKNTLRFQGKSDSEEENHDGNIELHIVGKWKVAKTTVRKAVWVTAILTGGTLLVSTVIEYFFG